jgi:hypothetical protein
MTLGGGGTGTGGGRTTSTASGTAHIVAHLGHLIFLPAAASGARSGVLQFGQVTLIGMVSIRVKSQRGTTTSIFLLAPRQGKEIQPIRLIF